MALHAVPGGGSAGGGTPGGSDTQVQYNDAGSFGGDANNTWNKTTKVATLTNAGLASTTATSQLLTNTTAATTGSRIQVSPSLQFRANGWRTQSSGSTRTIDFFNYVVPSTGTAEALGEWRLDYSLNGATKARGLQYYTNWSDGLSIPYFIANGITEVVASNSSTVDTLQNFNIRNPAGSQNHFTMSFGSTIRAGYSVDTDGVTRFRTAGSTTKYQFNTGSTIGSQSTAVEISGIGVYSNGGSYNTTQVTAGYADVSPKSTLNTYGSISAKGLLVTSDTTLSETTTFVYVDASNANICTGTPAACSSYSGAGQTTCETTHGGVGCTWTAEVTESCAGYGGVDLSTCQSVSGCTFDSTPCNGANNTDITTCESQDDTYGGTCSWDTSTCPAFSTTATCNAQPGCTATVTGDCTTLSDGGGDGTNCATQPECSYDSGTGGCSGSYFTSCAGNLCNGSYYTGACSGTHVITAGFCTGTALCSNLTDDGSTACNAESGCSWVTGLSITLPTFTNSSTADNVSRMYSITSISTGIVTISANTDETIFQYPTIKLNKKGDRVILHRHQITANCSSFVTEGSCTAQSGCSWSDPDCTGTYTVSKAWYAHSYERAPGYVEKSATYTLTDEDDIVNCTSGTFTVTLPNVTTALPLKRYTIKNTGAGTITVDTTSSQNIDGASSTSLTANKSVTVQSTGSTWVKVSVV